MLGIDVSLSRKSHLANHSNHGKRQKRLNSTDLLSHNNVGFSIFKWIKALRCLKILYFVVPVFITLVLLSVVILGIDRFAYHSLRA